MSIIFKYMVKDKDNCDSLKVQRVKIDEEKLHELEHGVWKFPSSHALIGHIASGKSTLLHNLLTRFWKPVFGNRIILFSPTAISDPIISTMIDNEELFCHFLEYSNDTLRNVLEILEDDETPDDKWLIVFDDCLDSIPRSGTRESRFFNKFFANHRHAVREGKISLVFALQKWSGLNSVIRTNLAYVYLMGKSSESELKKMSEEMNCLSGSDSKKFIEIYEKVKQDNPYNFMCCDYKKLRILKNFDELMFDALTNTDYSDTNQDVDCESDDKGSDDDDDDKKK